MIVFNQKKMILGTSVFPGSCSEIPTFAHQGGVMREM